MNLKSLIAGMVFGLGLSLVFHKLDRQQKLGIVILLLALTIGTWGST